MTDSQASVVANEATNVGEFVFSGNDNADGAEDGIAVALVGEYVGDIDGSEVGMAVPGVGRNVDGDSVGDDVNTFGSPGQVG